MHISYVLACDASVSVPRASYDTSAPNAKRKYQDEGETDEDKMEEYKASGEQGHFIVTKIKVLAVTDAYPGRQTRQKAECCRA